jgi:hypothetical protein
VIQRARYFAVKFLIFLASYLIRVGEATKAKERPGSLPCRKFEVDPPPLKEPLVEVESYLDYERLIKKEGILPIKRRVELAVESAVRIMGHLLSIATLMDTDPLPRRREETLSPSFSVRSARRPSARRQRRNLPTTAPTAAGP